MNNIAKFLVAENCGDFELTVSWKLYKNSTHFPLGTNDALKHYLVRCNVLTKEKATVLENTRFFDALQSELK